MLKINFRRGRNGIPILRKTEIELIAEMLLYDYNPQMLHEPQPLDIDHFAEDYVGLDMDYQDLSHNRSVLGMMVFHDCFVPVYDPTKKEAKHIKACKGTVLIDNSLLSDSQIPRGRFTVGHEVSHWLLHKSKHEFNYSQLYPACGYYVKCRASDIESKRRKFVSDEDWMEWQADYMSSALLMPKSMFSKIVIQKFRYAGIKANYYERGSDIALDLWTDFLPYDLADIFEVSVTAAQIRLENLQFIRERME